MGLLIFSVRLGRAKYAKSAVSAKHSDVPSLSNEEDGLDSIYKALSWSRDRVRGNENQNQTALVEEIQDLISQVEQYRFSGKKQSFDIAQLREATIKLVEKARED